METSLVEPGHFGASTDSISILEDFVSPLDLEHMSAVLPNISEWDNPRETEYDEDGVCIYDASYWWDRMCSGPIIKRINPFVYQMIEKYIDKCNTTWKPSTTSPSPADPRCSSVGYPAVSNRRTPISNSTTAARTRSQPMT